MTTEHAKKSIEKYGQQVNINGLKSGDQIICLRGNTKTLTRMKTYTVEYAYSHSVQLMADDGRIRTYTMLLGEGHDYKQIK